MNARRIPLLVGILLALGTGVLLVNYLGSLRAATPTVAMKTVVLAAADIPARAQITATMLTTTQRPATETDPDSLTDPHAAVGKFSLITIPSGSVLTAAKVGTADAFALPSRLPIGMRAVSISIDRVKGVAGLIQPGDRVDVIAVPPRTGNETPRAAAILRGVLVLAMGNELEMARATPSPDNQNLTTITLALTPKQVDLLAAADMYTALRLALRPPKEPIRAYPPEPLTLGNSAPAPAAAAPPVTVQPLPALAPPVPAVPPAAKSPYGSVIVIDGDRVISGGQGPR
jgi:pilus assembly protein CpaB